MGDPNCTSEMCTPGFIQLYSTSWNFLQVPDILLAFSFPELKEIKKSKLEPLMSNQPKPTLIKNNQGLLSGCNPGWSLLYQNIPAAKKKYSPEELQLFFPDLPMFARPLLRFFLNMIYQVRWTYLFVSILWSVLIVNIAVCKWRGKAPSLRARSCILVAISLSPSFGNRARWLLKKES